jgi:hypothetical protein
MAARGQARVDEDLLIGLPGIRRPGAVCCLIFAVLLWLIGFFIGRLTASGGDAGTAAGRAQDRWDRASSHRSPRPLPLRTRRSAPRPARRRRDWASGTRPSSTQAAIRGSRRGLGARPRRLQRARDLDSEPAVRAGADSLSAAGNRGESALGAGLAALLQPFFRATARCSWDLFIRERPRTPRRRASW